MCSSDLPMLALQEIRHNPCRRYVKEGNAQDGYKPAHDDSTEERQNDTRGLGPGSNPVCIAINPVFHSCFLCRMALDHISKL